jgi:hypothetical protein
VYTLHNQQLEGSCCRSPTPLILQMLQATRKPLLCIQHTTLQTQNTDTAPEQQPRCQQHNTSC